MSNRQRPARTALGLAAVAAAALAPLARAADRHWYGGLDNGDWQTPAHWQEGVVPTSADKVFVDYPNRTITLSSNVLVSSLTLTGVVGDQSYKDVGLNTSGRRLDVSGAAYVSGMSIAVPTGSAFTAPSFEIGPTGFLIPGLLMSGGTATFGTAKLDSTARVVGYGAIDLSGGSGTNATQAFVNLGTVSPSGGTLTLTTHLPWLSAGSIDLTAGSTLGGSQVSILGDLRATGAATITAPVYFTGSARVSLGAADSLSLRGPITYAGGNFSSSTVLGMIRQDAAAEVVSNTTIAADRYDWDGASDAQATTVGSGVTLSMSAKHIQDAGADVFRGTLNVNSGTIVVSTPWEMAGTANLVKLPRPPGAPTDTRVSTVGGSEVTITGTVRATNTASILAKSHLLAPTVVLAGAGDSLELAGPAEVRGGSYTGQGLLNFQGDASVTADTTIAANARFARSVTVAAGATLTTGGVVTWENAVVPGGTLVNNGTYATPAAQKFISIEASVVDLDGTNENGRVSVAAGATFNLAPTRIDATGNRFNGTIDIDNTNNGVLKVNVASDVWEMAGTLNLTSVGFPTQNALTGDTMLLTGAVNASGQTAIGAALRFGNGSTITVGPVNTTRLDIAGTLASDPGQTLTKRGAGELYIYGPQSHGLDATLHVEEGRFTLASDAGSRAARNLNLQFGTATTSATAFLSATQHLRSLAVVRGQVTQLGTRIVTGSLAINTAAAAQLDLREGNLTRTASLIVDYAPDAPTSPLADVRSYLVAGYHGGAWDGPGIVSSTARTTPATRTLGYAEAASALNLSGTQTATFLGETVDATAVLVRLTIPGDATLDGRVNFDDLLALARNYNRAGAHWFQGDFDYSGAVTFDDLLLLAKNYNAAVPADTIPGAAPAFAADMAAAFAAAVPEPGMLGLTLVAAAGSLGRRHRRRDVTQARRSSVPVDRVRSSGRNRTAPISG